MKIKMKKKVHHSHHYKIHTNLLVFNGFVCGVNFTFRSVSDLN